MKTAAIILLCLLAFLILLFVVPIRIICKIQTAGKVDFSLAVQVLFVRIPILPVKKRLPNIRKFRRGALERLYAKKQKKAEAAARKKEKKSVQRKKSPGLCNSLLQSPGGDGRGAYPSQR